MKAVFQRLGADAWGHSVADLLDELRRNVPVADALVDGGRDLDRAYIAARYPDAHPAGAPVNRYFRAEAERLVGHAEAIVQFVEGLLPTL